MAVKDGNKSTRLIALKALNRVTLHWAYPDLVLESTFNRNPGLSKKDAGFITELVYGVIRWLGKLDYVIGQFTDRVKKKEVLNILRMGAYQILFLDGVPDYAAINETVSLAKHLHGERLANFVNAVLREVAREKDSIVYPQKSTNPIEYLSVIYSFPKWLVTRWLDSKAIEQAEKLCHALNQLPPLTLRANTLKTDREELIRNFCDRGIDSAATSYSTEGINLITRIDPASLPEFGLGLFSVQDEASQLISYLVNPKPGERVLDTCSAPGGKTTHLAELMRDRGEIVALDVNQSRLGLVEHQAKRLGIGVITTFTADASKEIFINQAGDRFDRVLVDAPCSGLGTIRRNPDIKWRKGEENILELSEIQFRILSQAAKMVRPNGILVYSVCTMTYEENEGLCERFLSETPEFKLDAEVQPNLLCVDRLRAESGFFTTDPALHKTDGFFAARFRKAS